MSQKIFILLLMLALFVPATGPHAAPRDVLIHVTRIGGDAASAKPYMDRFMRYIESSAGWNAGSMTGSFQVTRKDAVAFIDSTKPGIGMIDPPLYFELRKAAGLQPVLQVESADLVSSRLHLVVKDPALKSLGDLKGKRLWTTLADYPQYLSTIVLGGQVDAAAYFSLKQVGQALRAVRGVLRGDCDAAILDDDQLAKAKEMEGGADLRVLVSSPALPPIPVVVFGSDLSAKDKAAIVKALSTMCDTKAGGAICKEMHIGRFVPVNESLFNDDVKRYGE